MWMNVLQHIVCQTIPTCRIVKTRNYSWQNSRVWHTDASQSIRSMPTRTKNSQPNPTTLHGSFSVGDLVVVLYLLLDSDATIGEIVIGAFCKMVELMSMIVSIIIIVGLFLWVYGCAKSKYAICGPTWYGLEDLLRNKNVAKTAQINLAKKRTIYDTKI